MVKKKAYKEIFCPNKHKTGCKSTVKVYNDGITPNQESAHNKLCKTRTKRALENSANLNVEKKVRKWLKCRIQKENKL